MTDSSQLVGYHGTKIESKESILTDGFNESKSKDDHWLGRGVYFYENLYYAIEWGIIFFAGKNTTYNNYKKKCAVIKATISLKDVKFLDLNDPMSYIYYCEIIKYIEEKYPLKINRIKNNGDIEIIRLIEEIEEKTGEQYFSQFDIVVARYPKDIYKKGNEGKNGDFLPCLQKQICVKNRSLIEKIENLDLDSSQVEEYFNIIQKNRKGSRNGKQLRNFKKGIGKDKKYTR